MPSFREYMHHIERIGRYHVRCTLCSTGDMHRNCALSHFRSGGHTYAVVKEEQETRLRVTKEEQETRLHSSMLPTGARIDICLGSEVWKRNIKALIYDFVYANIGSEEHIERHYKLYCRMEKSSLLELALWKASICDYVHFETLQDVYDYSALEEDFDPVDFVRQKRITSGVEVIIPRVMEFLGNGAEW